LPAPCQCHCSGSPHAANLAHFTHHRKFTASSTQSFCHVLRTAKRYEGSNVSPTVVESHLSPPTYFVLRYCSGGIIHLDDVGGAIAFQKIRDKKGKLIDTLAFSDVDEIALDYKLIQDTYGTDCYNIYFRQEAFNKFLKNIALA
jgi:hypothetical protein